MKSKVLSVLVISLMFSCNKNPKNTVIVKKRIDSFWCEYHYWDINNRYKYTEDSCSKYELLDSLK